MAEREEGTAAPNQRQGQNQQQNQQRNQDPAGQQQHLHINWSIFKPEFSGKPEEDAEAHLLCSNDWMNAHCFVDGFVDSSSSFLDFQPFLKGFQSVYQYLEDFKKDLNNPRYIQRLVYEITPFQITPLVNETLIHEYFSTAIC